MRDPRTIGEVYILIKLRKGMFLGVFFVVMVLSYGILYVIDFVPEPVSETTERDTITQNAEAHTFEPVEVLEREVDPLPVQIYFDDLKRGVTVLNPTSRNVDDLDAALLKGVVRHPDSADFKDSGNIFILGHSSYLPQVFNKNYQAFNDIQKLSWGDTIRLRSRDTEYIYRVDRVYEAKASEVVVPISRGEAKLTLATCDSFGAKDDRFVVEATLASTRAI